MKFKREGRPELLEPFLEFIKTMPDELTTNDLVMLGLWKIKGAVYQNRSRNNSPLPFFERDGHVVYLKQHVIDFAKEHGLLWPIKHEMMAPSEDHWLALRKHIRRLEAQGVTLTSIAAGSKVAYGSLYRVMYQKGGVGKGIYLRLKNYIKNIK